MFPARAGMSRLNGTMQARKMDVPRASGDEPKQPSELASLQKCSPRERG